MERAFVTQLKTLAKKREAVALILAVLIALVLLVARGGTFLDTNNLDSLQTTIAPNTIIAIGMMVLLISGVFDLSVGSVMGLSGVVTAALLSLGAPIPIAILGGVATGAVFGLINGALVALAGVNPLIATIGTMYVAKGLIEVFARHRQGFLGFDASFVALGAGKIAGVYYMFLLMLLLVAGGQYFVSRFHAGRQLYYVGGNRDAAQLLGINVRRLRIAAYCLSGVLASVAGILDTARTDQANRYTGEHVEMKVIIACLIGGGSIAGGRGSIVGALLGVTFMSLLGNSFNIFELSSQWQSVVVGLVLIVVVVSDGYLYLRKQRALGKL
jgi:ribose/xylose/arabinose/galactoside ABC-type transport system permease subunit